MAYNFEDETDHLSPAELAAHVQQKRSGWQPMDTAPVDRPILGWCKHAADPYFIRDPQQDGMLTDYAANVEGMSHVEDGPHVLEWSERQWESVDEYGTGYWLPG